MKTALITGGSRGLGKSMAQHLAERGVGLIVTYHSKQAEAEQLVKSIEEASGKAQALQFDATKPADFESFVVRVGELLGDYFETDRLDILVNNAGTGVHQSFDKTDEAALDSMYEIHLKGPYLLTQQLLPWLKEGSRVINISSGLARFTFPGYSAYAAMKGAIEVLTRYQAKEFGAVGVRVNTLAPGAIETDFGGGVVRDNKELNQMIASQTALGRVGLPEDVGAALSMLTSEESSWITGQRLEVSGGMFL